MFKLTFLGTSSGVPTRHRNVTSLALQTTHNRDWWMIDCGEATQHRLQRLPLSVHDLVGICITHVHGDHSYGLPGLLASASMTGRKKPLLLIAPAAIKAWIDATLLHTELFLTYPLIHIDVDSDPIVHQEAGLTISRHALSHRVLTLTGRFSVFRATHITSHEFIRLQEADFLEHWLWGRFRFLSGDDKSTWYTLLKYGVKMTYVPDATGVTIEVVDGSGMTRMKENLRRWSGNMLRNGARAIALGPWRMPFFICMTRSA